MDKKSVIKLVKVFKDENGVRNLHISEEERFSHSDHPEFKHALHFNPSPCEKEKYRKLEEKREKRNAKKEKNVANVYKAKGPENEDLNELCENIESIGSTEHGMKNKAKAHNKDSKLKGNIKNEKLNKSDNKSQNKVKGSENESNVFSDAEKIMEALLDDNSVYHRMKPNPSYNNPNHIHFVQETREDLVENLKEQISKLKSEKQNLQLENTKIKEEFEDAKVKLKKMSRSNKKLKSLEKLKCYSPSCNSVARHRCSVCRYVMYCSEGCSQQNWAAHREQCEAVSSTVEEGGEADDNITVQEKVVEVNVLKNVKENVLENDKMKNVKEMVLKGEMVQIEEMD